MRDDTVGGMKESAQVMALNANDARKDDNARGDDATKGETSLNWKFWQRVIMRM